MNVIRADTDQLRAVARQMRATADQITSGTDSMRQSMDALDATWSGQAHDRGMARWGEITPKYPPAVARLVHFANELEALAQRLDDAAAVFGGGGGGGSGGAGSDSGGGKTTDSWLDQAKKDKKTIRSAETKMDGIFDLMQGRKDEKPDPPDLQIYQTGENEFVVLLQGSDALQSGGMNPLFPNAFNSGMGNSTTFTAAIREKLAKLSREHPNAKVNLVGYSQGGIEAQNLARDQSFWRNSGLNIASISTYGTPNTYDGSGVAYNYDAPGDLVSNYATPLGGVAILYGLANPLTSPGTAMGVLYGVGVHTSAYYNDSSSETRQKMANDPIPWDKNNPNASKEWVLYDSADDGDHSIIEVGTAVVTTNLSQVTQVAVDTYNGATQTVGNVANATGEYIEETGEQIIDVAGNVIDGTLNAANDGLNVIKDAGSWAANSMIGLFNRR